MKTDDLNNREKAVLRVIDPGHAMLIVMVPSYAQINDFAAADALATLKKRGIVRFVGRGKLKAVTLTDEFEALGENALKELVA